MMGRPKSSFKDETGNRYGRLTVERFYGSTPNGAAWICKCDCGMEVAVEGVKLRNGNTRSCGCLRNMAVSDRLRLGFEAHGKERAVFERRI